MRPPNCFWRRNLKNSFFIRRQVPGCPRAPGDGTAGKFELCVARYPAAPVSPATEPQENSSYASPGTWLPQSPRRRNRRKIRVMRRQVPGCPRAPGDGTAGKFELCVARYPAAQLPPATELEEFLPYASPGTWLPQSPRRRNRRKIRVMRRQVPGCPRAPGDGTAGKFELCVARYLAAPEPPATEPQEN